METLESFFAALFIAGCEVDEEGPIVEGGEGVLEGEVADYDEWDELATGWVVDRTWELPGAGITDSKPNAFVCACNYCDS